ncbi:MAG: hypothetical protein ACTHJT_06230, partial [Cytophaga sp.]|uniref:hypothetical protein n=1 Tax=Cytophaga sp. TaxID=29535 RepID=UPI003F80858B
MKRLIPVLLFFFILTAFFDSKAQTVATYQKKWLFGMNWGGAWENADVHSRLGTGWGLTLEKEIIANNTSVFGFSLRGRYLHTWMWGRDYNPFYGVNVDENLNGVAYPGIDYTSQGFVYRNFYTKTDEFSLEGLLILNKLRAHSGFKIYGFGGIGATGYQTKINQLDGTNTMYDYSSVSSVSKSLTKQDLNTLWDNTYETNGVAGRTRSSYVLSGAIGVGIGIKLSPNVYLGWEHKYTYTSTDMLDASHWNNNSTPSLKNDRYHYSSLFLTVALGAGTAQSNSQPPTQTTYHPTPVGVSKPEITLKYPNQNPVTFGDCVADIRLVITNVSSINQITVLADGSPLNSSAYNYDNGSGMLSIRTMLAGNTTFTIIAENESGRDTKYVYANCAAITTPTTPAPKPQITIVSAVGYNCVANVAATIQNITDYRSIQVLMDGRTLASNQFTYDSYNGILKINVPFTGSTTITIRVNDSGYTVENSATVTCDVTPPVVIPVQTPPTIEVTNSMVSKSGTGCTAQIMATVLGVSMIRDITVTCNGMALSGTAYTFNPNTGTLNINYPIAGVNTFLIKARNAGGEVNSTVSLSCVNQPIVLPPSIILVYPATTSTVSNTCKEHIVVKIPNVTTIQSIDVRVNGVSMNKALLAFDANTGVLAFDAVITSQTQIDIHASNTGGNADQSLGITCKPVVAPTIQVSYPATEPFVSATCSETVVATVKGVSSKSAIHVTLNGQVLTTGILYDVNTGKLTIPVSITDRSDLVINAIGDGGSVSKTLTLICQPAPKPVITVIAPSANPVVSALCTESITVQVQNISSVNDLSVKLNGAEIAKSQLTYNTASGILVFPVTFTGASTVVIQATNASGVVSQSLSLQCKPVVVPKPVIKQMIPVGTNTISKTCHEPVQLQITNCDAVSNITVLVDGVALAADALSFDVATGMLSFQVAVKTQTSVVVTAKNKGGIATTTLSFQCKPTVQPSVSVLQPIGAPFVSTSCSENFILAVTNVSDINQIDVLYNNVSIDRNLLKYDTLTNKLAFTYAFTGNGNLLVKAKNDAGEDSKTIQLQCKPILAPELAIVKPTADPLISETCKDTVVASVKNITSADNIKVYANNTAVAASDILFDNASGTIRVINTYTGDREIKIVVSNEAGSVTKLAHLTCAPVLQPTVTLVNPATDNFTSTTCQENVLMTLTNITSIDQIAVKINSVLIDKSKYTFNAANGLLTIPVSVTTESVVEVVATNKTKTAAKTCKIVCNKIPLPTIKITEPASAVLDDCNTTASAILTDITSKDQIVITVNGVPLATTAFTFENNIVSFPLAVKSRSEVILTVTNTTGSATIKRTLVCNLSQVVTGPTGTCENTQKTSITNCTTCNDTIEASNGDINVPANKKVCITKPFNGNVNMNGGQLVICSNATIHNINFNSGDIVINGT